MSRKPVVLWFRNDLRLSDHAALVAASRSGAPVIPLYILDDNLPGRWAPGGASRWWLAKSLAALADDLAKRGAKLILRRGDTAAELPRIVAETGATGVYFTRSYEPWSVAFEDDLKANFDFADIGCRRFGGRSLREPEDVRTAAGEAYAVYTPFWRKFTDGFTTAKPLSAPERFEPLRCRNPIASQIGTSFRRSRTGRAAWQKAGSPVKQGLGSGSQRFCEDEVQVLCGSPQLSRQARYVPAFSASCLRRNRPLRVLACRGASGEQNATRRSRARDVPEGASLARVFLRPALSLA